MNDEQIVIDKLLTAHADRLIWEFRQSVTAREVLHAMIRARIEVRALDTGADLGIPTDEYVALLAGIARRELRKRFGPPISPASPEVFHA